MQTRSLSGGNFRRNNNASSVMVNFMCQFDNLTLPFQNEGRGEWRNYPATMKTQEIPYKQLGLLDILWWIKTFDYIPVVAWAHSATDNWQTFIEEGVKETETEGTRVDLRQHGSLRSITRVRVRGQRDGGNDTRDMNTLTRLLLAI